MKKIKLKTIGKADKTSIRTNERKHSVFLHSSSTHYFSDLKEAKAFLVKTNDFLTFKYFELNEIYIEIFAIYRRAWFYLNLPDEVLIKSALSEIESAFKYSVERGSWLNGSSYVFKWIEQISTSLQKIINVLIEMNKKRGNWAEMRVLKSIYSRISYLQSQVMSWPN